MTHARYDEEIKTCTGCGSSLDDDQARDAGWCRTCAPEVF